MLGYKTEDIYTMIRALGTAYEIIDEAETEKGISDTIDFLTGLLEEGRV